MRTLLRLSFALILAACPRLARADASLDELLDRWAAALGGRDLLAKPVVLEQHVTGKAYGMDADVRSLSTVDGRFRMEINLGGGLFTAVQIFDGERGWQVDQNGKLTQLENADLRSVITTAYADRSVQLLDPSRGKVELLEPAEDGPRIRCHPEGGDPITYVLDPESGLPLRSEVPSQERVQIATINGWKVHEGMRLPSIIDQSTGDPQYDAHLELREVSFHDRIDPTWFVAPVEESDDVVWESHSPLRDIPIELNTVHIFVQCSVNGSEPLWFVFDTGAAITVLNGVTADQLGLELKGSIEGRGAGEGSTEVKLAGNVSYGPAGVELRNQTIATIDLSAIEAKMGRALDGILGFDFISRFVVEIDYAGGKMHLFDRKGWKYEGDGEVLPLTFEGSLPLVQAALLLPGRDAAAGTFMIDTGANSAVIVNGPFAVKHDLVAALDRSIEYSGGFGVGGRSRSIVGRVPEFQIGSLRFSDPAVSFSLDEGGAHADPNRAGLIGGQVLKRCRVFFDYERAQMILEPHAGMSEPFGVDSLGLITTTGGRGHFHEVTVEDVLAGSAAETAGLQARDEILAFDGTPMSELDFQDMWTRIQQSNDRIVLRIRREGKEQELTVQLKPMI